MNPKTNILVVLLGPTGIGKTDISIKLAQHFGTEIISADSRQIFKELRIGTAVPSDQQLQAVKHHLIHSHSIQDYYSVSNFEKDTIRILQRLFQDHRLVILTGGSMLYIDTVCHGIDDIPDTDPQIRQTVTDEYNECGIEPIRLRLQKLDPDYYAKADLKNAKRLLHALEICIQTGKPYSSFHTQIRKERPFQILKIGLFRERQELYERINRRVDQMMEEGLEEEARRVFPFRKLNSLNTVGYKELFAYFSGETDRQQAIELIKRNSRRYARKQLTWFRGDESIKWMSPNHPDDIIEHINHVLSNNQ